MAEKDIAGKNLMAFDDIFADIVNAVIFGGDDVVSKDDLETETASSSYRIGTRLHGMERDASKFWLRNRIRIALFGLENQAAPDRSMPLRVIGYDGTAYRGQLCRKRGKGPWHPVVTIVLYFGRRPWSGPTSLLDCFDVDERLRPFVSDYRINVLDIPRLAPEAIARFRTEFRIVAEYFAARTNGTVFRPEHDLITHAEAFFDLMRAVTGDRRFEESRECIEYFRKEGEIHMCEVLDRIENIGRSQGMEIGEAKTVKRLMDGTGWTLDQAMDALHYDAEERARCEKTFRALRI